MLKSSKRARREIFRTKAMFRPYVIRASVCLVTWAAVLHVAGCVSLASAPSDWESRKRPTASCFELSGTYANRGELAKGGAAYLTAVFRFAHSTGGLHTPSSLYELQEAARSMVAEMDAMRIHLDVGPNNEIAVALLKAAEQTSGGLLAKPERPPLCSEGAITWSNLSISEGRGDPVVGPHTDSYEAFRGSDGYLYVKEKSGAAGLAYLFFPVGFYESRWMRFATVK